MSGFKRTRDLPNLNVCHGCQYRATNAGNDRLLTLASEWRIVLLCRKCYIGVESAEICSYCFSEASIDSFRCSHCSHRVHEDCALHGNTVYPRSEFSKCIDCWLPRLHSSGARVGDKKLVGAKCIVQKASNEKAKVNSLKKSLTSLKGTGAKTSTKNDLVNTPVSDEELTLSVQKCLNKSPRISRTSCPFKLDDGAVLQTPKCVKICQWNLELCNKKHELTYASESSVGTDASNHHTDGGGEVFAVKVNFVDAKENIAFKEEELNCSVRFTFSSGGENSTDLEANSSMK